jgi:hypothetical protein
MLGIPEERILRDAVTADRLLVAVVDRRGGVYGEGYESESLLFASRSLPSPAREEPARRRLFVSRAGADRRRLLNEAACMEALDGFDVELVAAEKLTVVDEIALFGEAELIVGGHGAGLVNCAFAPSDALVLELAPRAFWDIQIAELAAVKCQTYGVIFGDPVGGRRGWANPHPDYTVDVQRVRDVVRRGVG